MQNEPLTLKTDKRTTLMFAACAAAASALVGNDLAEVETAKTLLAKCNLTQDTLLAIGDALSAAVMPGNVVVHLHVEWQPLPDSNSHIC